MARARASAGAYRYKARTAASAFRAKRGPSSTSKAGRRQARAAAYRSGKLPRPGTQAADRLAPKYRPDTEEARWLNRAALDYELSGGKGRNPYADELRDLERAAYRRAYNAQHPRRAKRPAKPKTRVRVRAHWRRLRGR